MEAAHFKKIQGSQLQAKDILDKAGRMKVATLSLAGLIENDPMALNLFLPKGSRKTKCVQTQIMATYVRVL
eukprot:10280434-Karenia_brevis.AAC.1